MYAHLCELEERHRAADLSLGERVALRRIAHLAYGSSYAAAARATPVGASPSVNAPAGDAPFGGGGGVENPAYQLFFVAPVRLATAEGAVYRAVAALRGCCLGLGEVTKRMEGTVRGGDRRRAGGEEG